MKKLRKLSFLLLFAAMVTLCAAPAITSQAATSTSTTKKTGIVKKNGKKYYYKNGKLIKNKLGYKIGSSYYKISKKGVLTKVSKAAGLAGIQLESIGRASSNSKTLKKAFTWCSTKITYNGSCGTMSSASKYAIWGFTKKNGNCNVMAACFYQMAKVLGYNAKFVKGYLVAGYDSNGEPVLTYHAWVTIKISGKTYVYDPTFAYGKHTISNDTSAHSGYKMTYTKTGKKQQPIYYSSKKKLLT
ncbi:MAG: transglutaminase domain-containing protein [Lachnospiraceae bacterium]|nr:transglutaminase domain-containing protein [Lachnospiraceae bacterium]